LLSTFLRDWQPGLFHDEYSGLLFPFTLAPDPAGFYRGQPHNPQKLLTPFSRGC
jgi:hypothetical protein